MCHRHRMPPLARRRAEPFDCYRRAHSSLQESEGHKAETRGRSGRKGRRGWDGGELEGEGGEADGEGRMLCIITVNTGFSVPA